MRLLSTVNSWGLRLREFDLCRIEHRSVYVVPAVCKERKIVYRDLESW
jgi:hypothetical protein